MGRLRNIGIILLLVEIGLWFYIPLLVVDALFNPPQRCWVQVINEEAHPPVILSETPRSDIHPPDPWSWLGIRSHPLPWDFPFGPPPSQWTDLWKEWREVPAFSSGPRHAMRTSLRRPSVPWMITRILVTIALGGLSLRSVAWLRSKLPKPRGFEVELFPKKTTVDKS